MYMNDETLCMISQYQKKQIIKNTNLQNNKSRYAYQLSILDISTYSYVDNFCSSKLNILEYDLQNALVLLFSYVLYGQY